MKPNFSIGDRVRISALGASRCPRLANKAGTIIGGSIYTNSISIRFDGNRSSSTLHRDYIEAIVTIERVE
jgi:hypothetical protein